MKSSFLAIIGTLYGILVYGQEPIDVTEQTIKIESKSEKVMHFAFAECDKIVFNFTEINRKELKEIEILEYPGNSKFMDYKSKKIANKVIETDKNSIYEFRLRNDAVLGRVCKVKIQRIPASEATKKFTTTTKWIEKQDTTWTSFTKDIIIGYDTVYEQKSKKN
ncbi:MAG TPA: hypothetical protein VD905_20015 [Flavobacteriales bacterium]|nr:hypothetical protein [Flavobacteriales bacterium]